MMAFIAVLLLALAAASIAASAAIDGLSGAVRGRQSSIKLDQLLPSHALTPIICADN